MSKTASGKRLSPRIAIWHLGLRMTLKGAIIMGLLAGGMAFIQGAAYGSTFPDEKAQAAFKATMESAPGLGVLYGETRDLASATGYIVYRTVPTMAIIAAIWGLMTVTKLMRGQEEDDRWEITLSGSTTAPQASGLLLLGFGTSLVLTFVIATGLIYLTTVAPEIDLSLMTSVLIALAMLLPALLFGAIGMLTSQLSLTRRRAVMYGLALVAVFVALRAVANTVPDFYDLKHFTPFGWSDLISPVFDPQLIWLIPFVIIVSALIGLGVYLVTKRDLGTGFLPESTSRKPRMFLLGSATALGFRQNLPLFISWGISAIGMSALLASIMGIAAEAVADSPSLQVYMSQLGGSTDNLKIAFLGSGLLFVVIVLLIMAVSSMGGIRKDEAKDYLDNLLTQPVRRSGWLAGRLLLIIGAFVFISILCTLITWWIAGSQGTWLDLGNMLQISIALTGTVLFTLGLGVLIYGFLPKLAVIGMYSVILWSFIIDLLASVLDLNDIVTKSSLFHYISLAPNETPDWKTFSVLVGLGLAMALIGIFSFAKRDIVTE